MDQAPITRTASANTGLTCVEDGDESSSGQGSTTQQELNKDVESDCRTTKEPYHSSPATPQRHLSTVHQEPTSSTNNTSKLPSNRISHPTAWSTLHPSETWSTNPNLHARQLHSDTQRILAQLPNEPAYAFRDTEIRDAIWALMHRIEDFARTFFLQQQQQHRQGAHASSPLGDDDGGNNNGNDRVDVVLDKHFYSGLSPETARVIACVASGGPGGVSGWHDVFMNREKMQALVCGIIANVVSEQVLKHGFFGGTEEGVQRVREVEKDMRDSDGFDRKIKYAAVIRSHLPTPTALPANFNAHVNIIVGALYTHLSPLLALVTPDNTPTLPILFPHLQTLVISAGLLSLHMSLSPHTIYHHVPLFKEDTYVSSSMECFNERAMRLSNMRTSLSCLSSLSSSSSPFSFRPTQEELQQETARRNRLSETEKRRAGGDVPQVQIVCMEGITAYRRGGWEKNKTSRNEKLVFEKSEYQNMGIRARILTHGWTYCRWGRARSSSDSTQNPACRDNEDTGRKIHGDVWRDGGFVNCSDVEGVVDWLGYGEGEEAVDENEQDRRRTFSGRMMTKNKEQVV
ncbi:hypothetical protein AA0112_g12751 [Alternaria arborescens]|nr:hypothetical protein AA0112_g12751 [Alternaria arborescens]